MTCARALKIAGARSAGEGTAAGWRCRELSTARTVCTRSKAYVSYVFADG